MISAAGAEVLTWFFCKNNFEFSVTSEVLPGVNRSFTKFSAAAEEATLSRVFAGVHFSFDLTTGQQLGSESSQGSGAATLPPRAALQRPRGDLEKGREGRLLKVDRQCFRCGRSSQAGPEAELPRSMNTAYSRLGLVGDARDPSWTA